MNDAGLTGNKKALLIFPTSFYSFADIITTALVNVGYEVIVANDEYPTNLIGKLLGKLRVFWLLRRITDRVLLRRYVAGQRYELVLIVKGRGISNRLLAKMRHATARVVAYNFDSFGYNPAPLRWYKNVDKYCTFDRSDAAKYSIPLVELFSSLTPDSSAKSIRYELSAILRNHSQRLKYLDSILALTGRDKTFIYIFEQNMITLIMGLIKNPLLYLKYWSHIHLKALPYKDYARVLADSNFTVDYAHPSQSGITIRCFEAVAAQSKVITNNHFVRQNPFFHDGNTIVFDGKTEREELLKRYAALRSAIPAKCHRSVSDFLGDLLA